MCAHGRESSKVRSGVRSVAVRTLEYHRLPHACKRTRDHAGGDSAARRLECELCKVPIAAKLSLAPFAILLREREGRGILAGTLLRLAYRFFLCRRLFTRCVPVRPSTFARVVTCWRVCLGFRCRVLAVFLPPCPVLSVGILSAAGVRFVGVGCLTCVSCVGCVGIEV